MNGPEDSSENRIIDVSVIDPVCGMAVNPVEARGKAQYEGQTYYFCSPGCMHKFVSSPAKHLSAARVAQSEAPPPSAARKLDKDPVCGMDVDASKAAASVEYEGKLYHFCSRGCAEKFKDYPEKYLSPNYKVVGMPAMVQIGAAPVQIGRKLEKDLVCGMSVDPAKAAATAVHQGKTYYFCSRGCGEKFKADPEKYVVQSEAPKITAVDAVEQSKTAAAPRERPTSVPWIRRCANRGPAHVPSAAWRLSPTSPWPRPGPSGPAPCIPRSFATGPVHVRSAAWRWNRRRSPARRKRIPNCAT